MPWMSSAKFIQFKHHVQSFVRIASASCAFVFVCVSLSFQYSFSSFLFLQNVPRAVHWAFISTDWNHQHQNEFTSLLLSFRERNVGGIRVEGGCVATKMGRISFDIKSFSEYSRMRIRTRCAAFDVIIAILYVISLTKYTCLSVYLQYLCSCFGSWVQRTKKSTIGIVCNFFRFCYRLSYAARTTIHFVQNFIVRNRQWTVDVQYRNSIYFVCSSCTHIIKYYILL